MPYFGITDIGSVRKQNQDYFLIRSHEHCDWTLLVVCDGMGGAKSGNIASKIAGEIFVEHFIDFKNHYTPQTIPELMRAALARANEAVYMRSVSDPDCSGMGTTVVAAFVSGNDATILNCGDSRAYLLDNDGISQISHDHSYVQCLVDLGEITPRDARTHPKKNVITRAVGISRSVIGDIFNLSLNEGDKILLCSDGLTGMLEDDEIYKICKDTDASTACSRLIDSSLARTASDNVTVVIYQHDTDTTPTEA